MLLKVKGKKTQRGQLFLEIMPRSSYFWLVKYVKICKLFYLFLDQELSVSLAIPLSDKKPQAMANPTSFQRPLFSNFQPQAGYGYNPNMYGFGSMGYTQVKRSIFVLILHDYTCKRFIILLVFISVVFYKIL